MILSDLNSFRNDPMIKFKEEVVEGQSYTIVSYMIGNKELWDTHLADETRGITFETETGQCVSRPFKKFFNVGERADTDPVSVARDFVECYEKRDGSMLTPILTDNGTIIFKTKKSFFSDVANTANLSVPAGVLLASKRCLGHYNMTPIWEFTHPDHKIVIDYPESVRWTLLALRDNETGEYANYDFVETMAKECGCMVIPRLQMTWEDIQHSIENDKGIEGYVLLLKDGRRVKYKTAWYLQIHRTMTELRVRDVAEAVVNENIDDMKSLVAAQDKDIAPLEAIENQVARELQWLRSGGGTASQPFIGESFKDAALALKGTALFSLIMSSLRGKEPDYIDFWKKNYLKTYSLRVVNNPSFSTGK